MNTYIRIMKTINPKQGEGAWAVTKVKEGTGVSAKFEIVRRDIPTEQQARALRFNLMVKEGVFSV